MNKQLLTSILLFLFPFLLFSNHNKLASSAGTMNLNPINLCDGQTVVVPHNGDETLDSGDIIRVVLHDNSGTTLGNITGVQLPINATLSSILSGISFGATYYISAIAGMDDGNGNVDLTDPELSIAQGTPIVFLAAIETFLSETICDGDVINIGTNTFTQTGNYTVALISAQGCDSVINLDLTVLDPQAGIFPVIDMIDCSGDPVTVNAVVFNTSPSTFYKWSGPCINPGVPGDPSIQVTCAGTYELEVCETQNGVTCISETFSVEVLENTTPPIADAGPDVTLDCNGQCLTLGGTGSSTGSTYAYSWVGPNSNNSSSQFMTVCEPGEYCFFMIDLATSCVSATDCVTVSVDSNAPIAVASVSNNLDCINPTTILSSFGSSTGVNILYEWNDASGSVIGTSSELTVVIPGTYILTVRDTVMDCSSSSSVIVSENHSIPVAIITSSGDIDCSNASVTLEGSSSTGNTLDYLWNTGENTISIEASWAGTYTLTVTDVTNGCTDETSIFVDDTNTYQVDVGEDTFFPCNVSEMIISGNSIPTGTGFTYLWTTVDGSITSGEDTVEPTINSPGTYVLTVDDAINGCTGMDEIVIYDFNDLLSVTESLTLNCNLTVPNELEATLLLPNLDISYSWTTTNGNFTSATDIINPTVDVAGVYTLELTDNLTGCTATGNITMENPILPTAFILPQGNSSIGCNNISVILDGSNSIALSPATFQWSYNGSVFSPNASVTVYSAGVYDLVVTDFNGCSHSDTYVVTGDTNPPSFTLQSEVLLNCGNNFAYEIGPVLDASNLNVNYKWSFNGVVFSTDSTFVMTNDAQGVWELTITNLDNGCTSTNITEVSYDGFAIDVATTPAGCDLQDGTATASTVLNNKLVEWSTGEQGNTISDLTQGWYSVTVTDLDNNCSRHENFFVDEDISCKVVIGGYVLIDPNNTCTYDTNLERAECVMVKLNPLGIYTMTDSTGYYEFVVDDGSYSVEYSGSSTVNLQCPILGTYDVTLSTNGSISTDHHFYVLRPDFDLCITKNTGNARPGLDQFNCVQICNFGDEDVDATVNFVHDSLFSNQTPWPNISPAYGNLIAATYAYDEATHTFTWNLDDLAPGECRKIMWWMPVPVTAMIGDIISSEAKANPITGDLNPANNCLAWTQAVTGSYDPNDKRNFVGETQWGGAIYENDTTMQYAIRFQNVGNDTAFTVVVRDTLDSEHLDVTTVRGFTASHDMQVQFEDSNVLIFTFENIMLVDSATNEPASNGWLNFDIDRKPNQPFGTEITNQAAIYFDFNAPVITNELVNVLTNPVNIFSPIKNTLNVEVTPTVTNDEVRVNYFLEKTNSASLQIYNVGGVLLEDIDFGKKETGEHLERLSLKGFTAGVYFIFVKTKEGSAVRKVVKM